MNVKLNGLTAILPLIFVWTSSAIANEWAVKGERKHVHLSVRDFPDSPIPEFKASTQIKKPMATVLAVLLDVEACPQWIHQCENAFVLHQPSQAEKIVYQINKIAFARDRDLIFHARLSFSNNGKMITIKLVSDNDFCTNNPLESCQKINQSDFIRIPHLIGEYKLRQLNEGIIDVTWQQFIDPGRSLPLWIVKSRLDDIAYKTLSGLRKQVEKPKYKNTQISIVENQLDVIYSK